MAELDGIDSIRFAPGVFEKIWGGAKLVRDFGVTGPVDRPVGEAWLVSDHPNHESIVADGPLAGRTLRELVETHAEALLGNKPRLTPQGRFPLLLKLLDARDVLSVQVHPDDAQAKRLGESDIGKTEMWHVLQADPGSTLTCGLRPGVTPGAFRAAIEEGTVESMLVHFPVQSGVSVFVPAGTVHAIGGGIVLAEIQQNSDITYRLYDFGRMGTDGKPRELHIERGLEVIDFSNPHTGPAQPEWIEESGVKRQRLAACPYFTAERIEIDGEWTRDTGGQSFHIVLPITGGLTLLGRAGKTTLRPYEAVLVPGQETAYHLEGRGAVLDYFVA